MKGMKGRILKKLKSIPHVGYLKQGRILRVNASDGLHDPSPCPDSNRARHPEPEIIDVDELMGDLEDEGKAEDSSNKENIRPASVSQDPNPRRKNVKSEDREQSELNQSPFRRPDPNSASLFDPDLLAAFEHAVMDHIRSYEEAISKGPASKEEEPNRDEEPPSKIPRTSDDDDDGPLTAFEDKCPPGGRDSIVLYTTSLRGIRKTFEDCSSVRFLLERLKVVFYERDVSMHMEFREELWRVLEGRAIPPRLFIKGTYIGGADEVLGLHEQGKLLPLVEGLPIDQSGGALCDGCGGMRFVMCSNCRGSRKIYVNEDVMSIQCHRCNENGLVLCPFCC